MTRDPRICLKDILAAMDSIEAFVSGMSLDDIVGDDKTSSAVLRKFEVIGEAAKNVPDDIRNAYPDIPWKEMAGMRDKLIHFYFGVDYRLVWTAMKDRFPILKPALKNVLKSLDES
jgi:uncharacterized protein with HEPN domain